MNRTTAIFLALGILLAHALSIHRDYQWHFAQPFDQAHVAYALGENLADGEGLVLDDQAGSPGLQAYPSPLWVGLAWASHKLGWSPPGVAQSVGLLMALLLISLSTRIAYDRVAGVIPPLLLVLSGTMAAGAVCGTEHIALAAFAVMAFVAFEKGSPRWFALALALLVATRAETLLWVVCWGLFWSVDRLKARQKRAHPWWVFLPALTIALAFCFYVPPGESSALYPGVFRSGLEYANTEQGLWHLRDFVIVAVSPALLPIGLIFMLVGQLSGAGIRALILSVAWTLWVVTIGGDSLPFGLAYLPVMPLMCLVIQETIVAALDTYRPSMEAASWVILFITAFAAATASKFPGDVGPLSLQRPHTEWLRAKAVAPLGEDVILGRTQLHSEIHNSSYLRLVSESLAENAAPGLRVLSPWVGHLVYQTDLRIEDWFGRLQSRPGETMRLMWGNTLNARLDKALETRPDLVLPGLAFGIHMDEASMLWGIGPRLLSMASKSDGVRARVRELLNTEYRLHSLPIWHPGVSYAQPYFLYCRKGLGQAPRLEWEMAGSQIHLVCVNPLADEESTGGLGLPQMVDLVVWAKDAQGQEYRVQPTGALAPDTEDTVSLSNVILRAEAGVRTRLLTLPTESTGPQLRTLRAQLFHAGVSHKHPLAPLLPEQRLELP